jgi:hypothetical protein
LTCTSLDHLYPNRGQAFIPAGTPCYCGRRTWAGAPKIAHTLKVGARVLAAGVQRIITEKMRGEDVYRLDEKVGGRMLWDRDELTVIQ